MITLANTLGIVMLLFIAKALSSDNQVEMEPGLKIRLEKRRQT